MLFKTVFGNLIVISKHIRPEKADNSLFIKNNVLGVSVAKVEVTGAFSGWHFQKMHKISNLLQI